MATNTRVLVTNAYEVSPLSSGGHRRIKELYASLVPYLDVTLLTGGGDELSGGYHELCPGMHETRVARSLVHHAESRRIIAELGPNGNHPNSERLLRLNAAYMHALRNWLTRTDVVVTCHPYLHPLIRSLWEGPVVYHSHDVEGEIQRDLLPASESGRKLYQSVLDTERSCVRNADFTIAMSQEDAGRFVGLYGADASKMIAVPPSLDFRGHELPCSAERLAAKQKLMPMPGPLVVFMGSNWGPNVVAVRHIIEYARQMPKVTFAILGDVANGIGAVTVPPNVNFTGFVTDEAKRTVLLAADVALNPTCASSGVNMKMGEYFLAGVPVVTTVDGARGLALRNGEQSWVVALERFVAAIASALANPAESRRRAERAYNHARTFFDEQTNARRLAERFTALATPRLSQQVRTIDALGMVTA